MSGAGLVRGDATRIPLADGSVHLGICSPPYFSLRSYQDDGEHYGGQIGSEAGPVDFLRSLWAVADEMWRALEDGASWWINLGDKYAGSGGHNNATLGGVKTKGTRAGRATRRNAPDRYNQAADVRAKSLMGLPWRFAMGLICPDLYRAPFEPSTCWHDDGPGPCRTCPPRRWPQWIGRAEVIWAKPNGLPESVSDRVRRSHEQWFHVTKAPRYFAGIDEVREPTSPTVDAHVARYNGRDYGKTNGHRGDLGASNFIGNPLGKLPGSVRSVPSQPLKVPPELGVDHFAAFPAEWPRWIIAGWSPRGICTACGEGRRPMVKKEYRELHRQDRGRGYMETGDDGGRGSHGAGTNRSVGENVATITGYACACLDTSAPTRPAVVLDPVAGTGTVPMMARAMGRFGVGLDLSRDYLRLARWRVFESDHAARCLAKHEKRRLPAKPKKTRAAKVAPVLAAAVEQLGLDLDGPPAMVDVHTAGANGRT